MPPLSNLLEFVAWMMLQLSAEQLESDKGSKGRLLDWSNGRGGFLGDQMSALHDASVKLQVICHSGCVHGSWFGSYWREGWGRMFFPCRSDCSRSSWHPMTPLNFLGSHQGCV